MGGMMTPAELHRELAFPLNAKCQCGNRPVLTIRSFAEEKEMLKRDPGLTVLCRTDPVKYAHMRVKTRMGTFLRLAEVYACATCGPLAERTAAKHPSWCFVEIDRGPKADYLSVGFGT